MVSLSRDQFSQPQLRHARSNFGWAPPETDKPSVASAPPRASQRPSRTRRAHTRPKTTGRPNASSAPCSPLLGGSPVRKRYLSRSMTSRDLATMWSVSERETGVKFDVAGMVPAQGVDLGAPQALAS